MKRLIVLCGVVLILFSCEGFRTGKKVLDRAESLMREAPDSALAMLSELRGTDLPTRSLRARHALLYTMAQDKCYIYETEDSTIRVAYDWYQKHGPKRNRMLSFYYLGVVLQNAGEYLDAALAFREAEPLAEELEDFRQLSLVDQHLSLIFALNYDHVRALDYAERSLQAAEKAGESLMADYCRWDVAKQLLAEFRYEEAYSILKEVLEHSSDNPKLYSYASRSMSKALIFKSPSDISGAEDCYRRIMELGAIRITSEDYGRLALIHEIKGNSVYADSLLDRAFSLIRTKADSLIYYNDRYNVCDKRGDWKNAVAALSDRSRLMNEIVIESLGQSITHSMEKKTLEELELEKLQSRYRYTFMGLIGVALLSIIVLLFSLLRKKNRKLLEDMVKIQDVSDDLNRLKIEHSVSYELVEMFLADKVRSLQQLSESFFSWDDATIKKQEEKEGRLMKEDVIASFRHQLGELRNDRSIIPAMERSLNLVDNQLMLKARQFLPNSKELDFTILVLMFSGFSIKSISYLLRMSEPALRMRKSRFKHQFENLSEPERSLFLEKLG